MSIQSAVLFDENGKPDYTLVSLLHDKEPLKALQAAIRCVDEQGYATEYFRAWWSAGFPTRNPLPDEPISDADGVGTLALWQVLT